MSAYPHYTSLLGNWEFQSAVLGPETEDKISKQKLTVLAYLYGKHALQM